MCVCGGGWGGGELLQRDRLFGISLQIVRVTDGGQRELL